MRRPHIKSADSYNLDIWIAGDHATAIEVCAEFCAAGGLCVHVMPCTYVHKDGIEAGVKVGLINYPRFPEDEMALWTKARELGKRLLVRLGQESFSITDAAETVWFSWREADLA